jgi:hypothetical protein
MAVFDAYLMTRISIINKIFTSSDCKKLISYDGRNLQVSGIGLNTPGNIKVNVGSLSYHKDIMNKASEVALAIDDYQFTMCKDMERLDTSSELFSRTFENRTAILGLFTLFRAVVGSIQNTTEFATELEGIVSQMMSIIVPGLPKTQVQAIVAGSGSGAATVTTSVATGARREITRSIRVQDYYSGSKSKTAQKKQAKAGTSVKPKSKVVVKKMIPRKVAVKALRFADIPLAEVEKLRKDFVATKKV